MSSEHCIQQTNKQCNKNRCILVKSPAVSEPLLLLVAVPKRQQQNQPKVFINRLLELEAIQVAVQALASSSQEQDAARLIKQVNAYFLASNVNEKWSKSTSAF
jgi:hypothetical protein